MIKVDVSKALPATTFVYLAAFIPGLFFEISVGLGNPGLVRVLAGLLRAGYALGYYATLAITAIVGFIIGNGFTFFVRLFQRPLAYAYSLKTLLWKQSSSRW
jgi:hypothetical protein